MTQIATSFQPEFRANYSNDSPNWHRQFSDPEGNIMSGGGGREQGKKHTKTLLDREENIHGHRSQIRRTIFIYVFDANVCGVLFGGWGEGGLFWFGQGNGGSSKALADVYEGC